MLSVTTAEEFPLAFQTEQDPSVVFWLSTDVAKGLDEFDLQYADTAPGIIKSCNAAFTPSGDAIATTTLKVGTAVLTAAAAIITVAFTVNPHPDSIGKHTEQVVIKKRKDVRTLFTGPVPDASTEVTVFTFGEKDLQVPADSKVAVPEVVISLYLTAIARPELSAEETKAVQLVQAPRPDSSALQVQGIIYRQPRFCDVMVQVTKTTTQGPLAATTIASRTSFPQLGFMGVAPVSFSRKGGKRTTLVTFNTADGGLLEYKLNRESGKGTAATESGNLASALLSDYAKQRQNNTELQKLKDSNELREAKIKELEDKKKYDTLLTAP
ncbi:hypothetical protein GCM10027422_08950 [Hymenobacter arcticus]